MKLSRIVCASDSGEVSAAVLSYAMALAEWEDADLRVVHVAGSQQEHALYVRATSRVLATTVVVPGGDPAAAIVDYARALRLTQQAGGTLTLLHVLDEFRYPSDDGHFLSSEDYALRIAAARARLRAASSQESLNWCHVGFHVSIGATDVHILAAAHRERADLIVMGLTPRPNITPGSAYSMVERVAAQAGCPVLVVRAPVGSATWEAEYETPDLHRNSNAGELSQVPAAMQGTNRSSASQP